MAVTVRTAERLIRLAYDMANLANRLEHEGHGQEGEGLRAISKRLGNIGRGLVDKLDKP